MYCKGVVSLFKTFSEINKTLTDRLYLGAHHVTTFSWPCISLDSCK